MDISFEQKELIQLNQRMQYMFHLGERVYMYAYKLSKDCVL